MKKLSSFWLAVILGGITEAVFYGAGLKFASFGPCGPGNLFGTIFMIAHAPAFLLASMFPEASEIYLIFPFMALLLALGFWPLIAICKAYGRKRTAS